jgi:hypothetical protein
MDNDWSWLFSRTEISSEICRWLNDFERAALRATCRTLHKALTNKCISKWDFLNYMICMDLDACAMAIRLNPCRSAHNWACIILSDEGTRIDSPTMCDLALHARDLCNDNHDCVWQRIVNMTYTRPTQLRCSIIRWIASQEITYKYDWDALLESAAYSKDLESCSVALDMGAKNVECMLKRGAQVNSEEICIYAAAHGARDFDTMLKKAARGGHSEMCNLAIAWGARNMNKMLEGAARGGYSVMCTKAISMGATDFDAMIENAAARGDIVLCGLARDMGARLFDRMLLKAAKYGSVDLCYAARQWGAHDFDGMARVAVRYGEMEICSLALHWVRGADDFVLLESMRSEILRRGQLGTRKYTKEW